MFHIPLCILVELIFLPIKFKTNVLSAASFRAEILTFTPRLGIPANQEYLSALLARQMNTQLYLLLAIFAQHVKCISPLSASSFPYSRFQI